MDISTLENSLILMGMNVLERININPVIKYSCT